MPQLISTSMPITTKLKPANATWLPLSRMAGVIFASSMVPSYAAQLIDSRDLSATKSLTSSLALQFSLIPTFVMPVTLIAPHRPSSFRSTLTYRLSCLHLPQLQRWWLWSHLYKLHSLQWPHQFCPNHWLQNKSMSCLPVQRCLYLIQSHGHPCLVIHCRPQLRSLTSTFTTPIQPSACSTSPVSVVPSLRHSTPQTPSKTSNRFHTSGMMLIILWQNKPQCIYGKLKATKNGLVVIESGGKGVQTRCMLWSQICDELRINRNFYFILILVIHLTRHPSWFFFANTIWNSQPYEKKLIKQQGNMQP